MQHMFQVPSYNAFFKEADLLLPLACPSTSRLRTIWYHTRASCRFSHSAIKEQGIIAFQNVTGMNLDSFLKLLGVYLMAAVVTH